MSSDKLKTYGFEEEDEIRALLVGRKVVGTGDDTLKLDNGTILRIIPNEGCPCGSGDYALRHVSQVSSAIMDVRFGKELDGSPDDWATQVYRVFVLADGLMTELFSVEGTDGNGYYGTGYEVEVAIEEPVER